MMQKKKLLYSTLLLIGVLITGCNNDPQHTVTFHCSPTPIAGELKLYKDETLLGTKPDGTIVIGNTKQQYIKYCTKDDFTITKAHFNDLSMKDGALYMVTDEALYKDDELIFKAECGGKLLFYDAGRDYLTLTAYGSDFEIESSIYVYSLKNKKVLFEQPDTGLEYKKDANGIYIGDNYFNFRSLKSEINNSTQIPSISERTKAAAELSKAAYLAQTLEKKYDVIILLENQCADIKNLENYACVPSTSYDQNKLIETLETLDKILKIYPDGFFKSFKTLGSTGGVRIGLCDHLQTLGGSDFVAAGVTERIGSYYNIVVPIQYFEDPKIFHHEVWHAAEELITQHDEEAFAFSEWSKLNPTDFRYNFSKVAYNSNNPYERYILDKDKSNPYFIRNYSTVSSREDRATLVEYFMIYSLEETSEDAMKAYNELLSYPVLKEKVEFLEKRLKNHFGYVYWLEYFKNYKEKAVVSKTNFS